MVKELTACQRRCEDCINLEQKNGIWTCAECFNQSIEDIDDCPEGLTLEDVEKARDVKVKIVNSKDKPKRESKPRVTVVSDEKQALFNDIFSHIAEIYGENAKIEKENKLIIVQIAQKTFKIDLIEQRKKK